MEERNAAVLFAKAAKCRLLAQGQDLRTCDALLRLAEEYDAEAVVWTKLHPLA